MAKCNHDCFHCVFDDCINDRAPTKLERVESKQRDFYSCSYGTIINGRAQRGKRRGDRH